MPPTRVLDERLARDAAECPLGSVHIAFDPSRLLGTPDWARDHLIVAALAPAAAATTAWRALVERGLPDTPVVQRWLPLIGWHLRDAPCAPDVRQRLAAAHRQAWVSNTRTWLAAAPVLERLDAAGIDWLLLKGTALAWSVYETAAHRPIGDVDVLVRPGQAKAAHAVLYDHGWRAERATPAEGPELVSGLHGTNYARGEHGSLDLHAHALREGCGDTDDDGFWARSISATIEGQQVRILSPADQLLHVCIHGLRWAPVRSSHWLADAATIIRRTSGTLDWAVFVDEARRRQLTLQLHGALDLVSRLTVMALPTSALDALSPDTAPWSERLERRVKTRELYGVGGLLLMWYDWRRLRTARPGERVPGFSSYLAQTMRLPSPSAVVPHLVGLMLDPRKRAARRP
jgi:hypothetical protein